MTEEQAKLLQINDFVKFKHVKAQVKGVAFDKVRWRKGFIIPITPIEKNSLGILDDFELSDFEQIPLTDEILEKNGFSINVFENCMYYDFPKNAGFDELIKAHYHLIKYNSDDYYFFEDCPFINIRTVDELQRLLRLMGFVDFANNFKVI